MNGNKKGARKSGAASGGTAQTLLFLTVKRGIDRVEILAVQLLLRDAECIGETVRLKHYYHQSTAMSTVLFHTVIKG